MFLGRFVLYWLFFMFVIRFVSHSWIGLPYVSGGEGGGSLTLVARSFSSSLGGLAYISVRVFLMLVRRFV